MFEAAVVRVGVSVHERDGACWVSTNTDGDVRRLQGVAAR